MGLFTADRRKSDGWFFFLVFVVVFHLGGQLSKRSPIVLSFFSGTRSVNIGDPVIFTNRLCIARFLHFSFLYVYLIYYFPFAGSRVS